MAGVKLVCIEHGLKVGGCNCLGARVSRVPCPVPDAHKDHPNLSERKPGASRRLLKAMYGKENQ